MPFFSTQIYIYNKIKCLHKLMLLLSSNEKTLFQVDKKTIIKHFKPTFILTYKN